MTEGHNSETFDFEKTCRLAHLDVPEGEKDAMKHSIEDVLGYMDTLNQLDINDLEPSSHASESGSYLREDTARQATDLLMEQTAPDWQEGAFWVPTIKA